MKQRISQKLKTDKRTKMSIGADVLKTQVYLTLGNLTIKLSSIEAERIQRTLEKAVSIQKTNKVDSNNPLKSSFSKQELILVEKPKEQLTTLEKRLELCRYVYQVLKEYHTDLPTFRKSKFKIYDSKKFNYAMGTALARCHRNKYVKNDWYIVYAPKFLLGKIKNWTIGDNFEEQVYKIFEVTCHESAHLKIKTCVHCTRFWIRHYEHMKTLRKVMVTEKFWENIPSECFIVT